MNTNRKALNAQEQAVFLSMKDRLQIVPKLTRNQVVVAMIGLVGSHKSTVSSELAKLVGATVISGDTIRVLLRKKGEGYDEVVQITEGLVRHAIAQGGSVILDSDFIDREKRIWLVELCEELSVPLSFVCTYTEELLSHHTYDRLSRDKLNDFYGEGDEGRAIRQQEFTRRLPLHYDWKADGGGSWSIKLPPQDVNVIMDIETLHETTMKVGIGKAADILKSGM